MYTGQGVGPCHSLGIFVVVMAGACACVRCCFGAWSSVLAWHRDVCRCILFAQGWPKCAYNKQARHAPVHVPEWCCFLTL